jgi:hypothetical protein
LITDGEEISNVKNYKSEITWQDSRNNGNKTGLVVMLKENGLVEYGKTKKWRVSRMI